MKGKLLFAAGLGLGYVLGARAGRARYDKMKSAAMRFWNSDPMQKRFDEVSDMVKDKAPEVVGFLAETTKKLATKASEKRKAGGEAGHESSGSGAGKNGNGAAKNGNGAGKSRKSAGAPESGASTSTDKIAPDSAASEPRAGTPEGMGTAGPSRAEGPTT